MLFFIKETAFSSFLIFSIAFKRNAVKTKIKNAAKVATINLIVLFADSGITNSF